MSLASTVILSRSNLCFGMAINNATKSLQAPFYNIQKMSGRKVRLSSSISKSQSQSASFNPIAWYSTKLETHPIATKCITSGIIAGTGDLICQYMVHNHQARKLKGIRDEHDAVKANVGNRNVFTPDWVRTGRFFVLGFGLVAPAEHIWFGYLNSRIPGKSIQAVLKRLFCDQILFVPFYNSSFITGLMAMEGKSFGNIKTVLKRDVPDVLVTNWVLWIPAMFVNFRFVPVQWQVLYSNCVGLVWSVFLSWKTQEEGS